MDTGSREKSIGIRTVMSFLFFLISKLNFTKHKNVHIIVIAKNVESMLGNYS